MAFELRFCPRDLASQFLRIKQPLGARPPRSHVLVGLCGFRVSMPPTVTGEWRNHDAVFGRYSPPDDYDPYLILVERKSFFATLWARLHRLSLAQVWLTISEHRFRRLR